MHNVPLEDLSSENTRLFGNPFGEVIDVDDHLACPNGVHDFLRVRLKVDARKPFSNGF